MRIHLTVEKALAIKIYNTHGLNKRELFTLQSRVSYEMTALTSIQGNKAHMGFLQVR